MLVLKEGERLVNLARKAIETQITGENSEIHFAKELQDFRKKQGVFVTLHTWPGKQLRGCIGFPMPNLALAQGIIEAARAAAFEDPRFQPLSEEELDKIIIETSILSKPKQIETREGKKTETHEAILNNIEIGKDGLIIEHSGFSGLLLPQVPVEQKWDAEKFLENLCMKAGMSPETWKNPKCNIYKFQAQIFSETRPRGSMKEIKL